jgi:hypothetical protein
MRQPGEAAGRLPVSRREAAMNARRSLGRLVLFLLTAAVWLGCLPLEAAGPGKIQKRKERQQDRIAQGSGSGQLTPRETSRLEKKEVRVNRQERNMRKANGGALTPHERAKINRQQNRLSRDIYRQKHDAQKRH